MNKTEFEKYINTQFKNIPLEKLEHDLIKMQKDWIPQILDKKRKNKIKCEFCKKYSKVKDFKTELKNEIIVETTFRDYGNGDDDKVGEVEYLVTYRICPICAKQKVEHKTFIRIVNEWDRCKYKG